MHRSALRACSRRRAGPFQPGRDLGLGRRTLTTSPPQHAENDGNSFRRVSRTDDGARPGTSRESSNAAWKSLTAINNNGFSKDAPPPRPRPGGSRPQGMYRDNNAGAGAGAGAGGPKIISMRSLPRGLGSGPPRFAQRPPGPPGAGAPTALRPGFVRGGPRARTERDGGALRSGGFRSPGRGGGRAVGKFGRGKLGGRRRKRDDAEKKEKKLNRKQEIKILLSNTPEEQEFFDEQNLGVPSAFNPSVTLEGMIGDMPATQGNTDNFLGQRASIMQSMRLLVGGVAHSPGPVHMAETLQAVERDGRVYIHDERQRKFLNKRTRYRPTEETKQAILNTSVLGLYPAVKTTENSDILGRVAAYQNKNATYQLKHKAAFEQKLKFLMLSPAERAAMAKPTAAAANATAAKPTATKPAAAKAPAAKQKAARA